MDASPLLATGPYYRPSGRFSILGLLMMLVLGGASGVALGAAYGFLTFYNPFVYVNFLATVFFGACMGLAAAVGIKHGKVRSRFVATVTGMAVGGVGLYASWVFWTYAFLTSVDQSAWVVDPLGLWYVISQVAEVGIWGILDFTPTGLLLYLVWGIEAFLIVGTCAIVCTIHADEPFCEQCGRWAENVYKGLRLGPSRDPDALRTQLEAGIVTRLGELRPPAMAARTDVSLSACPSCQKIGFLTVEPVEISMDRKGNENESKQTLVQNLVLEADGLAAARELTKAAAPGELTKAAA